MTTRVDDGSDGAAGAGSVEHSTQADDLVQSLRQFSDQFRDIRSEAVMTDDFRHSASTSRDLSNIKLLVLDTNILISHLSLVEWVGDLLVEARKMGLGSGHRCGLLIPRMVRAEIDKHKMPRNRNQNLVTMLEPVPNRPGNDLSNSSHNPSLRYLSTGSRRGTSQPVTISLFEAASRVIRWMTRLYQNTPENFEVLKFQTKEEILDHGLSHSKDHQNPLMSPDAHILDCALYFKQKVAPWAGEVALLTNDKALYLDARIHEIPALMIQPGFNVHSLLNLFDPELAVDIEELVKRVNLHQMIMFDLYRRSNFSRTEESKNYSVISQQQLHQQRDESQAICQQHPATIHTTSDHHSNYKSLPPAQVCDRDQPHVSNQSQVVSMDIEPDTLGPNEISIMPVFPVLLERYFFVLSPLPSPPLLCLHYHIQQSVAVLLRQTLFEHLLHSMANGRLEELYRIVWVALNRRQHSPASSPIRDPNRWTAVECLMIIDELWIDGTCKIFEGSGSLNEEAEVMREGCDDDFDERTLRDSTSDQTLTSGTKTTALPVSRWTDDLPSGSRFGRICRSDQPMYDCKRVRRTVQVLMGRLETFLVDDLPRDNPNSWSSLLWDSLIEDVHLLMRCSNMCERIVDEGEKIDGTNDDGENERARMTERLRRVELRIIENWRDEVVRIFKHS
ncbi:PIN domain-containing protein [Phakopsora pachyrhizi]|uniref:PIN domain-domain-containing protein n=1 Tax=Phakopsora pachyrhizi TaxID=170000 RepID=A0AAV0AXW1_PHAPC|nr:PIN domain-containing protein [Phakopsora pachyrhizi]CAH7675223.1 PIN domain-domain-containing protein [Phakopsora pachyrhizi]